MKPRITDRTPYEDLPILLTVKEASILLNRNYKGLLDAVKLGRAPFSAKRVGGQYRVHKAQFQEKKIEQIFKR